MQLTFKDKLHPFRTIRKLVAMCETKNQIIEKLTLMVELLHKMSEGEQKLASLKARNAAHNAVDDLNRLVNELRAILPEANTPNPTAEFIN